MADFYISICDDEPIDLEQILSLLKEYDKNNNFHISIYSSADDMLKNYDKATDIALLDIEMSQTTGFELAKHLISCSAPPIVIFITKSNAYALKGYGIALRYIQKPIDKQYFFEAMDAAVEEATAHRMTFKINDTTYTILLHEILYIEILGHYATIYTKNNTYKLRSTLKDLISNLPQLYFSSPHKSYIVNLYQIHSAKADELFLCNGTRIPISRGKASEFNRAFYNFLGR